MRRGLRPVSRFPFPVTVWRHFGSVAADQLGYEMTTSKPTFRWKPIAAAVVGAIIATVLFAGFFPWLAGLAGLTLLAGGIAYAAWSPISERIAALLSLPRPPLQSRIFLGAPIVVYGVTLLALSQSQIRTNWRAAETRAEVVREIENANSALERDRVDEALTICSRLELKANSNEKTQIAAVRARAQAIENTHRTRAANAKVLQWVSDGRIHVVKRELDNAQSALEAALHVPEATEFRRATEFADEIVAARTKLAAAFLDNGELAKAKGQAQQAIRVPSAADTAEATRLFIDICNREVAQLVASARESLAKMNRDEAASALQTALAIRDATETAEAQKMLGAIREAREAEANARVATLMADAQRSLDAKLFDDALRTLNAAVAVPNSTQGTLVAIAIQRAQQQRVADVERQRKATAQAQASGKSATKRGTPQLPPVDIRVKSLNVKNVDGKFRYFFQIRNHGTEPFHGDVTISLKRTDGSTTWYETFSATEPMQPDGATVVYTDANTGPTSDFGEFKITAFAFKVTSKGGASGKGTGSIKY